MTREYKGIMRIIRSGVYAELKHRGFISISRTNTRYYMLDGRNSYDLDDPQGTSNIRFVFNTLISLTNTLLGVCTTIYVKTSVYRTYR